MRGPGGLVALAALGLAQAALWARGLGGGGAPAFPAVAAALFALQMASLAIAWRRRDAAAVAIVMAFSVAFRALAMRWPPDLSSDAQRYLWDARVADSGRNPYGAPPAAPALAPLRDGDVFPRINRPQSVTVYPPGAQAAFLALKRAGVRSVEGVRAAAALADVASIALLLALLRRRGMPAALVLAYAWSPLAISEIAVSGHVEAFVVPLVLGALLLSRRRPGWAGALVGAATLLKLYPALLLLAIGPRPRRRRAAIVAGAVVAAGYAPFVAASGAGALGFLPDYFRTGEDFNLGLRGFVQDALAPWLGAAARPAAFSLCAVALAVALARVARYRDPAEDSVGAACRAVAAFLAFLPSALHPWYALWMAALCALAPSAPWLWLCGALPLSYARYGAPDGEMPAWVRAVEWLPTYGLLLLGSRRARLARRGAKYRDPEVRPQIGASARAPSSLRDSVALRWQGARPSPTGGRARERNAASGDESAPRWGRNCGERY